MLKNICYLCDGEPLPSALAADTSVKKISDVDRLIVMEDDGTIPIESIAALEMLMTDC